MAATDSVSVPAASQGGDHDAVTTAALAKSYGSRIAVDSLDIRVPAGSVTGFVGPNGAGKSTTIRMLLGLVRPTGGSGYVLGEPVSRPSAYLSRVGALVEGPVAYPSLDARRNLRLLAVLRGSDPSEVDGVLKRVGLESRAGDAVGSFSMGMKQRLGIAGALLGEPELVVLDEPANGLDPAGIRDIRDLVLKTRDNGATVVVSSHQLAEIEQVCDWLIVLHEGRQVFQGDAAELAGEDGDLESSFFRMTGQEGPS